MLPSGTWLSCLSQLDPGRAGPSSPFPSPRFSVPHLTFLREEIQLSTAGWQHREDAPGKLPGAQEGALLPSLWKLMGLPWLCLEGCPLTGMFLEWAVISLSQPSWKEAS